MSSRVTNVIILYYDSTFDLVTIFCFLLFHDIKLLPTKTQYLELECLLFGDPTKSISKYPKI